IRAKNDNTCLGTGLADLADDEQGWRAGHDEVEHQYIGPDRLADVQELMAVAHLTDHLQVRLPIEDMADSIAHNRMVIGQEYTNWSSHAYLLNCSMGKDTRTVVPWPGRDSIVISPPRSRT